MAQARSMYRALYRTIENHRQKETLQQELRQRFRQTDLTEAALEEAASRLSVLKMATPRRPTTWRQSTRTATADSSKGGKGGVVGGRWIYKDGKRYNLNDEHAPTLRDGSGRVVSNWDGNNLDPDSVKRHTQQLHRAGFVNNAHAKGFF